MTQRIALVGYGAIGQAVHGLLHGQAEVVAVLVRDRAAALRAAPGLAPLLVQGLPALLARAPDLVVECAGHQAVDSHAAAVLRGGVDLVLVSVGSLADPLREVALREAAQAAGRQLLLPAGAIGGIDWLAAARTTGLARVLYRSRKPPQAWAGSAAETGCDLQALDQACTFFRGSAREAALRFPRNANVAATVALAGLGFDGTQVELTADPGVAANVHEIEADAGGGTMRLCIAGQPDAQNARTSVMTAHSVVRAIVNRGAPLVV